MPFKKGQIANPKGRPKGSKNKFTNNAINEIIEAAAYLSRKGKGLKEWAADNPEAFYTKIWNKLIPRIAEIKTDVEGEVTIKWQQK